jgi:hypothetical protein
MNLKFLLSLSSACVLALLSLVVITSFSKAPQGNVEGYVFPKEAKPYVEITIPKANGDTAIKKAMPNAHGYFKFNNIPPGAYTLDFWPQDPKYLSTSKNITVLVGQTANADTTTLRQF